MNTITILGSTGSIGEQTLQVLALHPERFKVFALTAHKNVERLYAQCLQYKPRYAVMQDANAAEQLHSHLKAAGSDTQVLAGDTAFVEVASHVDVDYVMASIVGAAGLLPTLAAAKAGKRILLANKESLVMSGQLLMDAAQHNGATIIPVDSEHSAIFQCLPANFQLGKASQEVKNITLTASGGAFRDLPLDQFENITPEQACRHPNWNMGAKITVDSATMMNKGLEVIEASWLFGFPPTQIQTILHPQSIIHSWVEYIDGSIVAQLGQPDMRTPIAYALSWPERIASGVKGLDFLTIGSLEFRPLSFERYPCLALAYAALKAGGTAATILNAANEVAVARFLAGEIRFIDIANVVESTLSLVTSQVADSLEVILAADRQAREVASQHTCRGLSAASS